MKKQVMSWSLVLGMVVFLFSCGGGEKEEGGDPEVYAKAFQIFEQSLDIREEMMEMEKEMKKREIDFSSMKDELKIWDREIIEVPGYEHDHDGSYDRKYHVHNPMKPFSDEEHLAFQETMYIEIQKIYDGYATLLKAALSDEALQEAEEEEADADAEDAEEAA
ncbi:hypothetical protein [Nitritalea halalkaliphila]|nr:hypothetical protein [Nitritalea halalkaliphila]